MNLRATTRASKSRHFSHGALKELAAQRRTDWGYDAFGAARFFAALPSRPPETKFARGETLFRQGDPADALYYIEKGRVRLTVMSPGGKQRIIAMLGARDFVGEGCLTGATHQIATASAMTGSEVVRIGKPTMTRLLRNQPALAELFTAFLLARNAELQDDLIDQLFNSCERRLARVLLRLADFRGGASAALPHISQEVLAERVGTTRPRVNAFIAKFRRLGYVEYDDTLRVHVSLAKVLTND